MEPSRSPRTAVAMLIAATMSLAACHSTRHAAAPTPAGSVVPVGGGHSPTASVFGFRLSQAPSGRLYAATASCPHAAPGCVAVLRSDDLGVTWQMVARPPLTGGGRLGTDVHVMLGSDTALWFTYGDGGVLGSSDGGRTWHSWDQVDQGEVAGGTAWLYATGMPRVFTATGGGQPVPTAAQPSGINAVVAVTPVDADTAYVAGVQRNDPTLLLFRTTDRGRRWDRLPTATCSARGMDGLALVTVSAGPGDRLWGLCAGAPPGEATEPVVAVTSTDHGQTWQATAPAGTAIRGSFFTYPEVVYPHSSAVAWYPAGQRLYRSRDGGAHWSPAGTLDGDGQLTSMALSGSDVAVYATLRPVLPPPDPAVLLHVTTDGGRTWTTHPLTATTPAPTSS